MTGAGVVGGFLVGIAVALLALSIPPLAALTTVEGSVAEKVWDVAIYTGLGCGGVGSAVRAGVLVDSVFVPQVELCTNCGKKRTTPGTGCVEVSATFAHDFSGR